MSNVRHILANKGTDVHSIEPGATVLEAVQKMNDHKIGALVVKDPGGEVVGIFTERDVLRRVLGQERSPRETTVGEVMTSDVVCCGVNEEIDDIAATMKARRIRHLPVCDADGKMLGLVSIGDVNAFHASDQEATIYFLNEYIYGRV